jgi:hypothetical protein
MTSFISTKSITATLIIMMITLLIIISSSPSNNKFVEAGPGYPVCAAACAVGLWIQPWFIPTCLAACGATCFDPKTTTLTAVRFANGTTSGLVPITEVRKGDYVLSPPSSSAPSSSKPSWTKVVEAKLETSSEASYSAVRFVDAKNKNNNQLLTVTSNHFVAFTDRRDDEASVVVDIAANVPLQTSLLTADHQGVAPVIKETVMLDAKLTLGTASGLALIGERAIVVPTVCAADGELSTSPRRNFEEFMLEWKKQHEHL